MIATRGALESATTQRRAHPRTTNRRARAWVPLPEILACAAQYKARIHELRRMGFTIKNRTERVHGERHSWFRLLAETSPEPTTIEPGPMVDEPADGGT